MIKKKKKIAICAMSVTLRIEYLSLSHLSVPVYGKAQETILAYVQDMWYFLQTCPFTIKPGLRWGSCCLVRFSKLGIGLFYNFSSFVLTVGLWVCPRLLSLNAFIVYFASLLSFLSSMNIKYHLTNIQY